MFDLIGYDNEITSILKNYHSKNLHSSIIFHGPKGIGKRLLVNKIINEIFKFEFEDNNLSHHINLFKNNTHQNVKIITKEIDQKLKKTSLFITIDQIRSLKKYINNSSVMKNFGKFIIVDSIDDLNISAANSFLKTLEEPNKNTYIFLISHQLSSLSPTLRSRCLKIKLSNQNFNNFKLILKNNIQDIKEDEIKFYFDLTYGAAGTAIKLYNENIQEVFDLTIESLVDNTINDKNIILADILSKYDNDKFKLYLSILKSILITLNKIQNDDFKLNNYLSTKYKMMEDISNYLSKQNIIDRFNYLINNESDLFTYNLDKKLFMLKFLTN